MAECGRCETCRHWDDWRFPNMNQAERMHDGLCVRIMADGVKFFPNAYEVEGLWTDADFGCVQWEAK